MKLSPNPVLSRRGVVKKTIFCSLAAAGIVQPALRSVAWAQGSDAPEKKEVKIGFIPLTDCASIVMASVLGLDQKYGVKFVLNKEASWAGVRDKISTGENDFTHMLLGMAYGMHLGTAGNKKDMAILMTLNHNGQGITLSKKLADKGAVDGPSLAKLMAAEKREYTFAQTFPTGTHAMWLYYWLASYGINPFKDAKVITVPPPQMVANMRVGNMDGFCVGEPWNHRAIVDGIGVSVTTTQDIWRDHPEKVLATTNEFAKKNPNTCRAATAAIIDAGRWIDASLTNKNKMAETIADKSYVNTSVDVINQRILGRYQNGMGKTWDDPNHMKFYNDGAVNYPYASDGTWFLTQHKRWGLIKDHPNYNETAKQITQTEIYKQAATAAKAPIPSSNIRTSKLVDGVIWDGKDPAKYADSFKIKA